MPWNWPSHAPLFTTNSLRLCPLSILQLFPTHMVPQLRTHITSAVESLLSLSQGKRFFIFCISSPLCGLHTSHPGHVSDSETEFWVFHWHISSTAAFSAPHWLCWMNIHLSQQSIYYVGWYEISLAGGFFLFTTSLRWYVKKLTTDTVQTWLMVICHNYTFWFTNYWNLVWQGQEK